MNTFSMTTPTAAAAAATAAVSAWDAGQLQNETSGFSNTTAFFPLDDGPLEQVLSTPNWAVLSLVAIMGLALAANLTVVVVVWRSKVLHAPFAVLASLALSDVLKTLTVMPLSILRLLFEGNLPRWMCQLWRQLYLSYTGLTLTHLAVGLLHCHVALQNPRWYRHMSANCTAGLQVLVSWLLPALLSLPHPLYNIWTQDPGNTTESTTATCLPVYPQYFMLGVIPTFLIPALIIGVIYIQVFITLGIQRRSAADMQPEPGSEVSSNGFVTYENSEASSSEEENGQTTKQHHHHQHQGQGYYANGYVSKDFIHHDVIIHDVMSDIVKDVEVCCEVEEAGVVAVEGQTAAIPSVNDDTSEPGSPTGQHPPQDCEAQSSIADSGLVALDNVDCATCGENMVTATASTAPKGIIATLAEGKQKAMAGVLRSTDCSGVNVMLVKAKTGKEALNEPLKDTATGDVHLQMAPYLIANSSCSPHGVKNPGFQMEDSDMTLSESIKPPKAILEEGATPMAANEASSSESLNVNWVGTNGGTPTGVSRTSSFSGDENGYRSILKWDRSKRSSTKSVKFAVPQEQETQQPSNKPRLLSCKYKTKNGQRIRLGARLKNPADMAGSAVVKSPVDSAGVSGKPKESLAKSAEFHYIEARRDPGSQLRARIRRNSRHTRLLLLLLVLCLVCTIPYVITLLVLQFGDGDLLLQTQSLIMFGVLEWLGYMPYVIYPVLYVAFSTKFHKVLKAMFSKTVSSN